MERISLKMTINNQAGAASGKTGLAKDKWEEVVRFFPPELRQLLAKVPFNFRRKAVEIRLRLNQALELNCDDGASYISRDGLPVEEAAEAVVITHDEIKKTIQSITSGSLYALEEELIHGYLTLPGGHRVGFTGHALQESGRIRLIKNISSINFRIAKALKGIARPILPLLWKDGRFLKTLIISAPAAGKTTLLREIVREFSYGNSDLGIPGLHVGLVDERSEIAGSYQGVPQLDIGPRTDVLDGAPKKEGIYLLLRAMNPQIIATDEIGGEDDFQVIGDVINAGVSILATAHARSLAEAMLRPGLKRVLETGSVERLIALSNRMGTGTIESIKAGVSAAELLVKAIRPGGYYD
ncbi:MAG: stage III sporulation protein AA [Bacillota bacterium]